MKKCDVFEVGNFCDNTGDFSFLNCKFSQYKLWKIVGIKQK